MNKPLVVQSDFTIMLEVSHPQFDEVMRELIKFSEIYQSPDTLYIFKITNLSIWNAIAMKVTKDYIFGVLEKYSQYSLPIEVISQIKEWYLSYGEVTLEENSESKHLLKVSGNLKEEIKKIKGIEKYLGSETNNGFLIDYNKRGEIKSILMKKDIPVQDNLKITKGISLPFSINKYIMGTNKEIIIRDYQGDASSSVYSAGNGTVVLPCGSGKTIVGVDLMNLCQTSTIIVTNSNASVKQWKKTLLAFTSLTEKEVGVYSSKSKEIKPVTILTYNMLAYKYKGEFIHFKKIMNYNFGLLICDEVHLMPAQMFRIVSSLQALVRLALTATFVREDGREKDIFTLIGPKRYDKPWKDLEARGYIARITLQEVRVPMSLKDRERYNNATSVQEKFEIASTAENKTIVVKQLMERHKGAKILIIGQFTKHLIDLAKELGVDCVYGNSTDAEREACYDAMRDDKINVLVASKIANAALDIPSISVIIQVSFLYGSRNEEAQRVGRATRPKKDPAFFYTLVSKDTKEEAYNCNRQVFLTGEGYKYEIKEMAA